MRLTEAGRNRFAKQRRRNMAERIQGLLQDRQVLAQMEETQPSWRAICMICEAAAFAPMMQVLPARNLLPEDPPLRNSLLEARV